MYETINKKLILKTADPLITSPKCAHSHLWLTYGPSITDHMARLATKTKWPILRPCAPCIQVVCTPVAQGDAKFTTLTMLPLFEEYLPTDLPNLEDNQELQQAKEARTVEGDAYLAKFI